MLLNRPCNRVIKDNGYGLHGWMASFPGLSRCDRSLRALMNKDWLIDWVRLDSNHCVQVYGAWLVHEFGFLILILYYDVYV
jgi:hypothetical protein